MSNLAALSMRYATDNSLSKKERTRRLNEISKILHERDKRVNNKCCCSMCCKHGSK